MIVLPFLASLTKLIGSSFTLLGSNAGIFGFGLRGSSSSYLSSSSSSSSFSFNIKIRNNIKTEDCSYWVLNQERISLLDFIYSFQCSNNALNRFRPSINKRNIS
jgi:hypothetical protein